LGTACHSVPFFLVLGNHDGESPARGDTLWATKTRKALIPNPYGNHFYKANPDTLGDLGTIDDYFAWEWGDALFIALDPYRYTLERPGRGETNQRGNWFWTLGEQQYRWLQKTLQESRAKYKFVFIHHLVGGADQNLPYHRLCVVQEVGIAGERGGPQTTSRSYQGVHTGPRDPRLSVRTVEVVIATSNLQG
jgi:hypothetical protein